MWCSVGIGMDYREGNINVRREIPRSTICRCDWVCEQKKKMDDVCCTGQDGNGNIFNALHCYMPNGKPQTFDWIYLEVMPKLVGTSIIKRNRVLITDGEHAMYIPHCENTRDPTSPWKKSQHKRCTFHLLTQKLINTVAFNNCKSTNANLVIQTVRYWLELLVKNVRYHYEYADCVRHINDYIDSNSAVLGSCLFPMQEIIYSLHTSRSYWVNCYHTQTFNNYHTTQSHTEAMNRSIKRMDKFMGSKSLHNSASTMLRQSDQLEKKRDQ